jgi:hypothetical protein
MEKYIIAVYSNPTDGNEDAYNQWYSDIHLAEVLQVPGFVAAQRFRVDDDQAPEPPKHKYLAIYEIEADEPMDVLHVLAQESAKGKIGSSHTLDLTDIATTIYKPITGRLLA